MQQEHTQGNIPDTNKTLLIPPKTSFSIPKAFSKPKTRRNILND